MNPDILNNENEISDLCVSCGMCCDGTLFKRATVFGEEDRILANDLGLNAFDLNNQIFFKLPCSYFSGCCTIYARPRPGICSAFFCNPIRKYQNGEQTFDDARQQVRSLLQYRAELLKIASQFPEIKNLDFEGLKSMLEDASEDNEKVEIYRHLFLIFFLFEDARKKYFNVARKDEQTVVS